MMLISQILIKHFQNFTTFFLRTFKDQTYFKQWCLHSIENKARFLAGKCYFMNQGQTLSLNYSLLRLRQDSYFTAPTLAGWSGCDRGRPAQLHPRCGAPRALPAARRLLQGGAAEGRRDRDRGPRSGMAVKE